jgi:hypothetical protein
MAMPVANHYGVTTSKRSYEMIKGHDVGGYRLQSMTEVEAIEEGRRADAALERLGPEKYAEVVLQMALKVERSFALCTRIIPPSRCSTSTTHARSDTTRSLTDLQWLPTSVGLFAFVRWHL